MRWLIVGKKIHLYGLVVYSCRIRRTSVRCRPSYLVFRKLEPYAVNAARTVLRGGRASNGLSLPDFTPWISVTMQFVSRLIEFATNHYLLVAALLVLLVLLLLHELRKGGKSLSTRELTALVNADQAVVLDIRPAKEFASGHIVDALNIPADKLNSRMTELEKYKGKTIILVDAMGQHSGTWGGVLKKAGFNAAKLSGGIGSWRGDNLPLVK